MSIELDFQRGVGRVFANYTCEMGTKYAWRGARGSPGQTYRTWDGTGTCYNADPIGFGFVHVTGGSRNTSGFNEFYQNSFGSNIELAWNMSEPASRINAVAPCSIVGRMVLRVNDDGGVDRSDGLLRDFPSFEGYQYRAGVTTNVFAPISEHDLPDLCASR